MASTALLETDTERNHRLTFRSEQCRSPYLKPSVFILGLTWIAFCFAGGVMAATVVFDGGATASSFRVVRGEVQPLPAAAPAGMGGAMVCRVYAPDDGKWDSLRLLADNGVRVGKNLTLLMWVNFDQVDSAQDSRLRRIDLLLADGTNSRTRSYEPQLSRYTIDGVSVDGENYLQFDADPKTWQQLRLDITSGPGITGGDVVQRVMLLFTQQSRVCVAGVRFEEEAAEPLAQLKPGGID
ncbi:MAG: hypothetical protein R3C45_22405, partial [Phycisphaerales bacterium]